MEVEGIYCVSVYCIVMYCNVFHLSYCNDLDYIVMKGTEERRSKAYIAF